MVYIWAIINLHDDIVIFLIKGVRFLSPLFRLQAQQSPKGKGTRKRKRAVVVTFQYVPSGIVGKVHRAQ
jgi:hypothetical protein